MINEPKKYIFILGINDKIDIVELSWVMCSGFDYKTGEATVFEFIDQERFNKVIQFHQDTENHCPFLSQSWLSRKIDLWESSSDFIIYDTEEEAKKAGALFKLVNECRWPEDESCNESIKER